MKILLLVSALLLQAPFLSAGMTGPGMLHGDVAIGGMSVSGADLNKDYKTSTYDPQFGDSFSLMVSAQGGWLTPYGFYTDLGFDVGPLRTITSKSSTVLLGLPYTIDEKLDFTQYRLLFIPGFMLPIGKKLLFSAQAGLGYSFVSGVYTNTTTWIGSSTGGYTLTGGGFDYVPELRLQYLFKPRLSAGLAIGWNGSKYSQLDAGSATGTYEGYTFKNPVKTADGTGNASIDHTGIFAKLVISTYLKDLIPGGARQEVSRAPVEQEAMPASTPSQADKAKEAITAGTTAYKAGDYVSAQAHYTEATDADPQSAKAWQGLGNALAQQRKKAEALDAYDKSLAIDPSNAKLKAYVDSLRK